MTLLQTGHTPLYSNKHFWINRRTAGKVNPEVFFGTHSFQHQEGIGQRYQRDVMMPPLPRTAFKMIQSHFPLHLLVILFNTEASFRLSHQPSKRSPMRRQAGKPILPGVFVSFRPLDQQLLQWFLHRFSLHQSMGHPDDHTSKPRRERSLGPLSPGDVLPTPQGQFFGNLTETSRSWKVFRVKAFPRDLSSSFHRRTGRMGIFRPSRQFPADLNDVIQRPISQSLTEFIRISISRIRQHKTIMQSPLSDVIDHIQRQLRLCLKDNLLGNTGLLPPNRIPNPSLRKIQGPVQGGTGFLRPQIYRHCHLTVGRLSQSTAVLTGDAHRMITLLWKGYLINEPVSFRNKFSFHFSGQRRSNLLRRPRTLIRKLLQSLNVSIRKTSCHWLDGFAFSIHQETSNVFLGMLSPLFASHGQNDISQEGLQFQPESLYLSGFHTPEDTTKCYRMSI